jgi:dihydrofolate reductase
MAENRVIGRGNEVPWHLPDDLRHFKELTTGHTVIMGRKTFDSIGRRPLARRRNIVLTRDPSLRPEGLEVVGTLARALELAAGEEEVFVAGGADIYRVALPIAHRIYLTVVHANVEGDVRFPEFDLADWRLTSLEHHQADHRHRYPFTFRLYERAEDPQAQFNVV